MFRYEPGSLWEAAYTESVRTEIPDAEQKRKSQGD